MGNVGLLYVGAVLALNGLMLLGHVPGRAAAAMNLFVGGMQVVFPTLILLQSGGDPVVEFGASGLYLFGFTYLYVAWNELSGASGEGLGWFSLFVSGCAVLYGVLQFTWLDDPLFGVIWFAWSGLWFLFFLVLGAGRDDLTHATGWFTLMLGILTGAVPAFLLLTGSYRTGAASAAIGAAIAVVAFVVSWFLGRAGVWTRMPAVPSPSAPQEA